jgi:hypothetical protein
MFCQKSFVSNAPFSSNAKLSKFLFAKGCA